MRQVLITSEFNPIRTSSNLESLAPPQLTSVQIWVSNCVRNAGGYVMSAIKTGHCMCGAVCFEYEGEESSRAHCHCESCRRATSSPFTTWTRVQRENFRWTAALPKHYVSSPSVTRTFCSICGSPMSYEHAKMSGEIDIYAASLDDHANFQPQRHDFWSERVSWVNVVDKLEKRAE
jgi:hypothetical protein